MGGSISNGIDWHGHRTASAPVVYVAAEGGSGIYAVLAHGSLAPAQNGCYFLNEPVHLLNTKETAEFARVIERLLSGLD
jgi:hypothetical protein